MKGRNTTVISVRLPDKVVAMLAERANRQDLSIGEYIKAQILKSLNGANPPLNDSYGRDSQAIPLYNPSIHKPGDRVLVKQGKRLIAAVVPELDVDGNAMP